MEPREHVRLIAAHHSLTLDESWSGGAAVWPLLELMKDEGAVVIVKLDGERKTGHYTVMASGAPLDGEFLRKDADTVEEALASVIAAYATRVWAL